MTRKIKHIVLFFSAFIWGNCFTQDLPFDTIISTWDSLYYSPENSFVINIECTPLIDGQPLTNDDYIIAYQKNSLIGYTKYESDSNNIISSMIPTKSREDIMFNIYKIGNDTCLLGIDDIETITDTITKDGTVRITSMQATTRDVNYGKDILCSNEEMISNNSLSLNYNDILYSSDDSLKIDLEGNIYLTESIVGTHLIKLDSKYCLKSKTLELTIVEPPNMDEFRNITLCSYESLEEKLYSPTYSFYITDTISETITDSNSNSSYNIVNIDSNGCKINQTLLVNKIIMPAISISEEYLCNKTRLSYESTDQIQTINWSNGISTNTVDIYHDTIVELTVSDYNGCQNHDSFEVFIRPFQINKIDYTIEESSCWEYGKINLISDTFYNGTYPYTYSLTNILNYQQLADLKKVPEGIYRLHVKDARDCEAEYDKDIIVLQDCLNDYPVFTPNADGNEDEYFIPYEGIIEIFDKNGRLIKKMETPAYWDGKDSNNKEAPMGNYVILTDKGKSVNITIIK